MKCVIFDHDGTLMDSMASVAAATNEVLVSLGFPPLKAVDILKDLSSRTSDRVTRLTGISDPDRVEEIVADFYRTHVRLSGEMTRTFPGINMMLETIHSSGIDMGIVSNCRGDVVKSLIEINGLGELFPIILGEEDFVDHKPSPAGLIMGAGMMNYPISDCIYIGDGMPDFEAARAAGMPLGMVTWGHMKREKIKSLSPDYIFETPGEISELFS